MNAQEEGYRQDHLGADAPEGELGNKIKWLGIACCVLIALVIGTGTAWYIHHK